MRAKICMMRTPNGLICRSDFGARVAHYAAAFGSLHWQLNGHRSLSRIGCKLRNGTHTHTSTWTRLHGAGVSERLNLGAACAYRPCRSSGSAHWVCARRACGLVPQTTMAIWLPLVDLADCLPINEPKVDRADTVRRYWLIAGPHQWVSRASCAKSTNELNGACDFRRPSVHWLSLSLSYRPFVEAQVLPFAFAKCEN